MKKIFCTLFLIFTVFSSGFSQYTKVLNFPFLKWWEPAALEIFRKAFPDVKFVSEFDGEKNDWLIHVYVKNTKKSEKKYVETKLYWCECRFLPEDKINDKYNFQVMLYEYPDKVPDPKDFSEEKIEHIKVATSSDNRRISPIFPPYLYNAIFDCADRTSTESHIVTEPLFKFTVNVNEQIAEKLKAVKAKINKLPVDEELSKFYKSLTRTDGYVWRTVRDTQSRSFHSMGLAIDILPKGYYQKIIYWGWQKQLKPDSWFMTPVENRWSPPQKIIDAFESEGFIWGGKWMNWDNMHFDYRPEIIEFKKTGLKNIR